MARFFRIYAFMATILIAICYAYYLLSSSGLLQLTQLEDRSLARLGQQLLTNEIQGFPSDLMMLANMQKWNKVFEPSNTTAIAKLADDFKTLLLTKKNYEKASLFDLHGKELLQVRAHQGGVKIDLGDALQNQQNKKHHDHIKKIGILHENKIYISSMELNRENGKGDQPLALTMRLMTPVFDTHGQQLGLLVLNVLVKDMLQRFMGNETDFPKRSLLLDQKGGLICDNEMIENKDNLRPAYHRKQFRKKFPTAWQRIDKDENGQFLNEQGMFTFLTFRVTQAVYNTLPENLKYNDVTNNPKQPLVWKIIEYRSPAELAALTEPTKQRIVGFTLLFLLLLAPLAWNLASNKTNRETAAKRLRDSEHKFRHLVEELPDGLAVIIDAKVVYANKMLVELFRGKSVDSIVGKPMLDFVHPESRQMVIHRNQTIMNGQSVEAVEAVEEHLLAIDGTDIFAMVTSTSALFEGKLSAQTVIRDITEQRRAEGALRISQQRHKLYMAQTNMAVIEWGIDFTVVEWNQGAESIFGFSADYAKGKHVTELILSPDKKQTVDVIWQQLLSKGGDHTINENITSDGRIITCEWYNTPLIRKDGNVVGVTSLCCDISEKQRHQIELRKLQQAIEYAGEAMMITDADAVIEYVNPAFAKITGYRTDEVIGLTPTMLNSGRHDDAFFQRFWQQIACGETWHGSLVNKRKDGSLYPALMSVAPIFDDRNGSITHYVSVQQDMSAHEELEEKFLQAQKMEALGTLVAGVAHDFNNVLAGMMGNLYLVKKLTASNASVQTKLERIDHAGQRAAGMIRQLLAFARKSETALAPMQARGFIKEIMKLARLSIPDNIALLDDFGKQDQLFRGDSAQIQQIMLNLLVNASHALEGCEKPVITVSMQVYKPDDGFLLAHKEMEDKPLLCITVADNGCGISKANIEHVLEPFFTTKAEGKGTGLGLAMVFGAMRKHGGVIDIDSEEGKGTRMNLYFPLLDSGVIEAKKKTLAVINGNGESILLVDDNKHLRATMKEVLQDLGYRVLVAKNGQQALLVFTAHASEIKLALLDVVMPVMGGIEAAERLRELQSDLPILLLSGYEKELLPTDKPMMTNITVLTKPIDPVELSIRIHKSMVTT